MFSLRTNSPPRFRNAPACGAQTRGSKTLEPRRKVFDGMDMHALARDANGVAMICMSLFKKPPIRTLFAEKKGLLSEEFQWDVMDCVAKWPDT